MSGYTITRKQIETLAEIADRMWDMGRKDIVRALRYTLKKIEEHPNFTGPRLPISELKDYSKYCLFWLVKKPSHKEGHDKIVWSYSQLKQQGETATHFAEINSVEEKGIISWGTEKQTQRHGKPDKSPVT